MRFAKWVAAALAAALAACGPGPAPPASTAPQAAAGGAAAAGAAAIDGCPVAARAFCANAQVADLSVKLRAAFADARFAGLPAAARQTINENQQSWLAAQAIACGAPPAVVRLDADQLACVKSALEARLSAAPRAVEQQGPFRFLRVEINTAEALSPEQAAELDLAPTAPRTTRHEIAYPQIVAAESAAAEKFNAAAKRAARFKPGDGAEEQTRYDIAYAGPDLISIQYFTYDMSLGAARPNNAAEALNFNLKTAAPLAAQDVFKPGSGWERYLAQRAAKAISDEFRRSDMGDVKVLPADVLKSVSDPKSWIITPNGLTVIFPPYSFSPSPLSGPDVSTPWADLKRFLKPGAPAPIGA